MSSAIGPGDFVECVNTAGCAHIVPLHSVHMVEDVASFGDIPCLILKGVVHPKGYRKVRADCFRPIYRPKSSIIEQLKQPISEPVRELLPID